MFAPFRFLWTGSAMVPISRDHNKAAAQYDEGHFYDLVPFEERSKEEHGQFFAVLREAWAQWPESEKENYRNVDHFRAQTLIALNYCRRQPVVCETEAEAQRWVRVIGSREPYSIVEARGSVVMITTAESMRVERKPGDGGMPRKRFNAAKNECFEHWAQILGCAVEELLENSKLGRHKKAAQAA